MSNIKFNRYLNPLKLINIDCTKSTHFQFAEYIKQDKEINANIGKINLEWASPKKVFDNAFFIEKSKQLTGFVYLSNPQEFSYKNKVYSSLNFIIGIVEKFRHQGLGYLTYSKLGQALLKFYPNIDLILMEIEEENKESENTAKKAGFIKIKTDSWVLTRKKSSIL